MKKAYQPYIIKSIPVINAHFDDNMEPIRKKCMKCINNFVMACTDEKDMAGVLENTLPQLLPTMEGRLQVKDSK